MECETADTAPGKNSQKRPNGRRRSNGDEAIRARQVYTAGCLEVPGGARITLRGRAVFGAPARQDGPAGIQGNKMTKTKKIACGVIAAALVLGSAASAQAWTAHGGGGHGSRVVVVGGRVFVGPSVFVGSRVFVGPSVFVGPRVFVGGSVFVGPVWWGPGWYPYPYYYPYPPPMLPRPWCSRPHRPTPSPLPRPSTGTTALTAKRTIPIRGSARADGCRSYCRPCRLPHLYRRRRHPWSLHRHRRLRSERPSTECGAFRRG